MQREQYELNWKNYYEILQVSPNAEPSVIKAAHNKLAQTYHPDTSKDPKASEIMTNINEAYEVLSDPVKRSAYDKIFKTKYPIQETAQMAPKRVDISPTKEREPPHVPPEVVERSLPIEQAFSRMSPKEVEEKLIEIAEKLYETKEKETGSDTMRLLERLVMLQIMDRLWVEHLTAMEHMRLQAGWQTLRQTRSVDAYKSAGYQQFQTLLDTIRHDVAHTIFHVRIEKRDNKMPQSPMAKAGVGSHGDTKPKTAAAASGGKKVGRNDPCPCGSGKKYKNCCGK